MGYGTLTVGRLTLRETFSLVSALDGSNGERRLRVEGQESVPPLTMAQLRQRQEDILGLRGAFVPITFTDKTAHSGWYLVTDTNTDLTDYTGEVARLNWSLAATRIGAPNEVDVESRVVNLVRTNGYGQTGTRWHAPSLGASGYYTGSTVPSILTRTGSDGAHAVYLSVPSGVNPVWTVSASGYYAGASRLLVDSTARSGTSVTVPSASASWEVHNGLVSVAPGASGVSFVVSSYTGGAWRATNWNWSVTASGSGAVVPDGFSVLRNDPEMVTIRLLKTAAPGRALLDLSIRRGSRFVEAYIQAHASTTLGWYLQTTQAGTAPASAGYVTATASDAGGNRFIVGSAGTFTANTTQGGLSKAATTTLDLYVGMVAGGASAVSGDQAADLQAQYIATMSEQTMGVRR